MTAAPLAPTGHPQLQPPNMGAAVLSQISDRGALAYACRQWILGASRCRSRIRAAILNGTSSYGVSAGNVAYPICYRQLEEMMEERGVGVDHSTLNRWVLRYAPLLEHEFRKRKCPEGRSWRIDETYVKVKGVWKYLVSSRRQGRRHRGLSADCQAGP